MGHTRRNLARFLQPTPAVAMSMTGVAVALWATRVGPHMDTSFELARLQQHPAFLDFLRAVADDNQPPVAMSLTWLLFNAVTMDSVALRILIALGLAAAVLAIAHIGFSERAPELRSRALLIFAFGVALAPSIAPTLLLLRYSGVLAVLWLAVYVAMERRVRTRTPGAANALGLLLGASLATSYSALALFGAAGVWLLVSADYQGILRAAIWALPGVLANLAWAAWAGPVFVSHVLDKAHRGSMDRLVAAYENLAWPLLGAAALPSAVTVALLALGGAAAALVARGALVHSAVWVGINLAIPGMVFGWAALVNGNMAGATLALMYWAAPKLAGETSRSRGGRLLLAVLASVFMVATSLTWANYNVLRPFIWSNASPQAVSYVQTIVGSSKPLVINGGDQNTLILLREAGIGSLIPAEGVTQEKLAGRQRVVLVWGNETDKHALWSRLGTELQQAGFHPGRGRTFGNYTQSEIRAALGMYNTEGPQYRVIEFSR